MAVYGKTAHGNAEIYKSTSIVDLCGEKYGLDLFIRLCGRFVSVLNHIYNREEFYCLFYCLSVYVPDGVTSALGVTI